jgi:hypothetical protein
MTAEQSILIDVYAHVSTPADRLPYSIEMDRLLNEYSRRLGSGQNPGVVWQRLMSLRKNSLLPKLGRHPR